MDGIASHNCRCTVLPVLHELSIKPETPKKPLETELMESSRDLLLPKMAKTGREYMIAYDVAGKKVLQKAGGKKSIGFTDVQADKLKETYFFHSHPNGSSFSPGDVSVAARLNLKSMNAVHGKYSYKIKPKKGLNWSSVKNPNTEYLILKDKLHDSGQVIYEDLIKNGMEWREASKKAWMLQSHRIIRELARKFNLSYTRTAI